MEVTAQEGVHLLILFAPGYSDEHSKKMLGYLELSGTGNTAEASRRGVSEILRKTDEEGGITVVPHPFSSKTGLLDGARKLSTKMDWLASGFVRLIQAPDDKIRYIGWDKDGRWVNRYVLASATEEQVIQSDYCLAPLNISDCYSPDEVNHGCSWFRMGELSIEGLKQVACEPAARIRKTAPAEDVHNAILAVRVSGGFCDGQSFLFSSGLSCIVGQNHAGKSAIFDFIRFALGTDDVSPQDVKSKLFSRLTAILGVGGQVDLLVRQSGTLYLIRRVFQDLKEGAKYFRFDPDPGVLAPVDVLRFPVEIYEQGRIHRLREDVNRQLDMLDEFAGLQAMRREQDQVIENLKISANEISPLKVRQGSLAVELAQLPELEKELGTKEAILPQEEKERPWVSAAAAADSLGTLVATITGLCERVEDAAPSEEWGDSDPIWQLFNETMPEIELESIVEPELFRVWVESVSKTLSEVSRAKALITQAARKLKEETEAIARRWEASRKAHESQTTRELATAGVDSPQELLNRVADLRATIHKLKTVKQPQREQTTKELTEREAARVALLDRLRKFDVEIRDARSAKALELTNTFGGQIDITLKPFGDRAEYKVLLTSLYSRISSREQQIKNIDAQLSLVADKLTPLALAEALQNKGVVTLSNGKTAELANLCGITHHTQSVLCTIANEINLLNRLQTARTPDILQIRVKRQGESVFADLTSELSQGEQSAALLTLTLQSRVVPLILDQPEDELGYNYVVNLIVPKILQAKFGRQMLVITHNANVPVLGDADFVIKMENKPKATGGRQCLVAEQGCFESPAVTATLLELEGGKRAFEFRRHRYDLAR